jgi:hypothetical protein
MKKILLSIAAVAITASASFAQTVLNPGFENWGPDTSILDLTTLGGIADTFSFQDPDKWTSSNAITGSIQFGNKIFTSQSSDANGGTSAVKCLTDSITLPIIGAQVTLPGFVVNGDFKISLTSFTGSSFDITNIPGAGAAISPPRRLAKLSGFYKYAPITVGADSCAAIAVLRKGQTIVATATFFAKAAQSSYTAFSADFVYSSCEIPDSAIIVLSSSNPYALEDLIGGGTATVPIGSEAWFDDIALEDTTNTFSINPVAVFDNTNTAKNTAKVVAVTANDIECYGRTLTVTSAVNSVKGGTVSVSGTSITYTPANNFTGNDTFSYSITAAGSAASTTQVRVDVYDPAGFNTLTEANVAVYPNPSQNVLFVEIDATEATKAVITDLVGRTVAVETVTANKTAINTSSIATGVYVISLVDNNGRTRFSSKFNVQR